MPEDIRKPVRRRRLHSQSAMQGAEREAPRAERAHLLHADELRAEVELNLGLAHGCLERVRDGREDRLEQLRDPCIFLRIGLRRVACACSPEHSASVLVPVSSGRVRTADLLDHFSSDAARRRVLQGQRELAQVAEVRAAFDNEHITLVALRTEHLVRQVVALPCSCTPCDIVQVVVPAKNEVDSVFIVDGVRFLRGG